MQTKPYLTLGDAKAIANAAHTAATSNGWTVVIAILDAGANLLYLERMDGTQIGSIQVAIEKAKTAVSFKRPTKILEDAVNGGRTHMLRLPGATPIEGGLPLVYQGEIVGAIGVSGVQSFEDGIVAKAGADVLTA